MSLLGDVNEDGSVTAADVTALQNAVVAGESPSAGDVNEDGSVTAADVTALFQQVTNQVDPIENPQGSQGHEWSAPGAADWNMVVRERTGQTSSQADNHVFAVSEPIVVAGNSGPPSSNVRIVRAMTAETVVDRAPSPVGPNAREIEWTPQQPGEYRVHWGSLTKRIVIAPESQATAPTAIPMEVRDNPAYQDSGGGQMTMLVAVVAAMAALGYYIA